MGKLIDLTGQRFGFWVAKKRGANNKSGQSQWICKCECGKKLLITSNSLRTGNSTSCGCNNSPDLTALSFGLLKVINQSNTKFGRKYWNCKCSCDNYIIVSTYKLRNHIIDSCKQCSSKELTHNFLCEQALSEILDQMQAGNHIQMWNDINLKFTCWTCIETNQIWYVANSAIAYYLEANKIP